MSGQKSKTPIILVTIIIILLLVVVGVLTLLLLKKRRFSTVICEYAVVFNFLPTTTTGMGATVSGTRID